MRRGRGIPWCLLGLIVLSSCAEVIPAPEWQVEPVTAVAYPFPALPPIVAEPPPPPVTLTASDGTGLKLVEIEARAVIEEPLAFTELRLVFDNPEDRRLEGNFSIVLPGGAALSRFSMKINDDWQEGEVVEKKAAREAYEDFLHRRQDPALLEQAAGNQFSARVFPIPARGRKEIIVSYSQELEGDRPYTLPLKGLPELGKLSLSVMRAGEAEPVERLEQKAFTPAEDFTLAPAKLRGNAGLRSGDLVLARVNPIPAAEPDPIASAIVLVDTSASRALGYGDQIRVVARLAQRIAQVSGSKTMLAIGAYDQGAELMYEGEAGSFGEREMRRLRDRQAFGASNLERALGWAEAKAKAHGYKRVILVGDGVATAGETDTGKLAAKVRALGAAGVERLDAVAVGGIRDDAALKRITTAGLLRDGVLADGASDPAALIRKLTLATKSNIPVKIEGARWQWPERLDGVQSGDEVLVYAEVPASAPVRVSVGGVTGPALDLVPVERPLLERSWAKAKIASLLALDASEMAKPDLQRAVVSLSTKYRVLSPYTSLLVLETERDFARFGLDRKSLADILTVDGGKLAVARRSSSLPIPDAAPETKEQVAKSNERPALRPPPGAPPPDQQERVYAASPSPAPAAAGNDPLSARGNMWGQDIGDSFGAGGLGLAGVGAGGGGRGEGIGLGSAGSVGHGAGTGQGQGFGSSHGRLGGAHRTAPPAIRMGATQVSGRVPPEVIQRIVRQNFGRFRACYEDGMRRKPNLQGRVSVRFVIQQDGSVRSVQLTDNELDVQTGSCVARSFFDLSFPSPEGGVVTVTYPLQFSPEGSTLPPSRTVQAPPLEVARPEPPPAAPPPPPPSPKPSPKEPYTGRFKTVMDMIGAGGAKAAIESAFAWHHEAPGDVMALVALGEALEAAKETSTAARVYGSIVDLFPARADLRRFAGNRLERLAGGAGSDLALDTFEKAEEERPDHPESHRLVAFAKLRAGDYEGAFAAIERGMQQPYPNGRFRGVDRILREDLGLVAAAWAKKEPARREEIREKVRAAHGELEEAPSLRFVLSWETDANDVDFHIHDAEGGHAYYKNPELRSGGQLYADVTTGYGPECFTIRLPRDQRSARYDLEAHYYSRGPMGYGMGKLEIIDHDGMGGLTFEERPFVVMADGAFVNLGSVTR